jgi:hypothetical protein
MVNIIELLGAPSGVVEVQESRTFTAYKNNVSITIVLHDRGPAIKDRYSVEVFDSDLVETARNAGSDNWTLGNPDSDLEGAIMNAHWDQVGRLRD